MYIRRMITQTGNPDFGQVEFLDTLAQNDNIKEEQDIEEGLEIKVEAETKEDDMLEEEEDELEEEEDGMFAQRPPLVKSVVDGKSVYRRSFR